MERAWLIAIRENSGISQKCVSEQIGVSQPSYSNIENGKRTPSVRVAKKIAAALGFDWTQFYEDPGGAEQDSA